MRRKTHGSYDSAAELAEGMPFVEYALHQQVHGRKNRMRDEAVHGGGGGDDDGLSSAVGFFMHVPLHTWRVCLLLG